VVAVGPCLFLLYEFLPSLIVADDGRTHTYDGY